MKLLILTQYYPPEIGAPQNRLHELAIRLKAAGLEVEVLTAMPNYPKMEIFEAYRDGKITEETIDGIRVYRSGIYVSKSKGIAARLRNYFSFVYSSWKRGQKLGNYDYLMVESPPLFLGYSAMRLSRKLKAKMIFNVSDLWPESAEKLGIVTNKSMLKVAYNLEARCYTKASLITGQTNGIVTDIRKRFPEKQVHWLPNGVDLTYYDPAVVKPSGFRERNGFKPTDLVLFYGGILGHAQGLQLLVHAAGKLKDLPEVKIVLQGAGPEKDDLLALRSRLNVQNIHFLEPVAKSEMPGVLKEIDIAVVPLRKLELFEGAIPSKIFESLAMENPLLLGVDGEARTHFIEKADAGLFFEPENVEDLVEKIRFYAANRDVISQHGINGRKYVMEHFNRNKIAADFYEILRNN